MMPVKPIPSMTSPATIAASTIAISEPPISLLRVIRCVRRRSAEPRPIGCARTRRWRPPAWLSRTSARPSRIARSVSVVRSRAIRPISAGLAPLAGGEGSGTGERGEAERRRGRRAPPPRPSPSRGRGKASQELARTRPSIRRQQRGLGGGARGLGLAFGAGDVALGLVDLVAEHVDGLLHAGERLDLEIVDLVHRVVDVLERALQRLHRDRAAGGLLVDLGGVLAQQLAGGIDDARGRLVER